MRSQYHGLVLLFGIMLALGGCPVGSDDDTAADDDCALDDDLAAEPETWRETADDRLETTDAYGVLILEAGFGHRIDKIFPDG